MNPFPLVLADMRRGRAGVAAVVAVIAVAVALGVAVTAQERALRRGSARAADAFDLVIGARGSPTQLILSAVYLQPTMLELVPGSELLRLDAESGVAWAAPLIFGDSWKGRPIVGSTASFVSAGGTRGLAAGRIFLRDHEAVVGAAVPLAIGETIQPSHGLGSTGAGGGDSHQGALFHVVGRLPRQGNPWDGAIIAPVEALWAMHARSTGHTGDESRIGPPWDGRHIGEVSAIVVKPKSVADAYRLRARYRTAGTTALFPAEVLLELYATLGDARDLLALVTLATQVLVVAAVLLAVLSSLAQRRRQIGVLRALGAPRAYLFAAVWAHVTALIGAGALLGLLLGYAGSWALSAAFHARTGIALPVSLSWPEAGLATALVGAGAMLAMIPAWRSCRLPVATALKA
ncbi:MAG TPA: FtsX-like permease family protein [Terriglobales bacterium]|nr:FtsX-like permease family protein [Terriglobales bacterium]